MSEDLFQPVLRCKVFQQGNDAIIFAGIKQGKGSVVAGNGPIQKAGRKHPAPAAEGVDDKRQRHLIQPGVEALPDQSFGRVIADRQGEFQKTGTEFQGAAVIEPARVEIEVPPPVAAE